ncbi:MAG: transposase [Candidatus Micrarchaeota archaeon]|nr:transposase [Candidatus Micrarchaeota archaeon]
MPIQIGNSTPIKIPEVSTIILKLINNILGQFQICFKRKETFSWFIVIMMGILVRTDSKGVSSIIGALHLCPCYYESILHFFRSEAFDLKALKHQWMLIVQSRITPVTIGEKPILIGDHIKVGKEARFMPGVKKLHQDSENVGKSEYIFGHQFGMLGLLANAPTNQCIPLDIELHDGIDKITAFKKDIVQEQSGAIEETSIAKMIQMVGKYVKATKLEIVFLLDAFFASASAFNTVDSINQSLGKEFITLITRAKSNTVAFEDVEKPEKRKSGRPRKYGKKVILKNIFKECFGSFKSAVINLYGKSETVNYLCLDLLWKPIGKKVRFVLVKTGEKTMILMCSNFSLQPEQIILAYSYRFKIEVTFKMLKHVVGGFFYHFWTKAMPKLSRYKTNIDFSSVTELKDKVKIVAATRAIEIFVFLSCIALGVVTILSIEYPELIWKKFSGWLRTKSSPLPSAEVVRTVLQHELLLNFGKLSKYATLSKIQKYQRTDFDEVEKVSA